MSARHRSILPKKFLSHSHPGYDPSMEARVAVLEEVVRAIKETLGRLEARMDRFEARMDRLEERQERDFRLLFGALITAALGLAGLIVGLAGLMAHGFGWL